MTVRPYIIMKVSYTEIWPPPCNTGQLLAISTAALSESALIMEYPVAIVPTEPSRTVPSLAMLLACGVKGLPPSKSQLDKSQIRVYTPIYGKQPDNQERERIAQLAATCVCNNLRRAARAATNYDDSLLGQATGLRVSQCTVLVVLYLAGPQTMNALAEQAGAGPDHARPQPQATRAGGAAHDRGRARPAHAGSDADTAGGGDPAARTAAGEQAQAHMVAGMGQRRWLRSWRSYPPRRRWRRTPNFLARMGVLYTYY